MSVRRARDHRRSGCDQRCSRWVEAVRVEHSQTLYAVEVAIARDQDPPLTKSRGCDERIRTRERRLMGRVPCLESDRLSHDRLAHLDGIRQGGEGRSQDGDLPVIQRQIEEELIDDGLGDRYVVCSHEGDRRQAGGADLRDDVRVKQVAVARLTN